MSLRQKRREVQQFVTIVQGVLSCRKTEKMLELVADDHQILLEMGCNALPTFLDKDPQRRRCKSGFFWFLTCNKKEKKCCINSDSFGRVQFRRYSKIQGPKSKGY